MYVGTYISPKYVFLFLVVDQDTSKHNYIII